ncbi:hypothetical protein WIS52_10680 [Pseudonocardia nematodicida]|uniref:Uncharacterized protein n=1 Tax=Pseudonocardia nematodicida TaxID=1206997 RepID=A0ABV1KC68_9PSEU
MSVTDLGPVRSEPRLDPQRVRFSAALLTVLRTLVRETRGRVARPRP